MQDVDVYLRNHIDQMLVAVKSYIDTERYIEAMKLLSVIELLTETLEHRKLTGEKNDVQ